MSTISDFIYDGVLDADGTIRLDHPPELPPGPVQVTLRARIAPDKYDPLLPDPPWPDESIPPPCDLPIFGPRERVTLREIDMLLPDPLLDVDEEVQ